MYMTVDVAEMEMRGEGRVSREGVRAGERQFSADEMSGLRGDG